MNTYTADTSNYCNQYGTTYQWRVTTIDGKNNQNIKTYSFTTNNQGNNPPSFSSETPINNANNIPTTPTQVSIIINDLENDPIDWSIETNPDIGTNSDSNAGNGIKTCAISGLQSQTTYTWYVNATDGNNWRRKTYTFTTQAGAPTITNPIPSHNANNVPIALTEIRFTITDPQNDLLDYTITSTPNIGSTTQTNKQPGTYTMPINGLSKYHQVQLSTKLRLPT